MEIDILNRIAHYIMWGLTAWTAIVLAIWILEGFTGVFTLLVKQYRKKKERRRYDRWKRYFFPERHTRKIVKSKIK